MGISSGAFLAGRRSGIIMQNSGIGHVVNALTSFNMIYKIPVLMLVTWRGRGADAPEHSVMGRKTLPLLKCLGIPCRVLTEAYSTDIDWAIRTMRAKRVPVALIIREGMIG